MYIHRYAHMAVFVKINNIGSEFVPCTGYNVKRSSCHKALLGPNSGRSASLCRGNLTKTILHVHDLVLTI